MIKGKEALGSVCSLRYGDGVFSYDDIPTHRSFDAMADPESYVPLPDDWVLGTSDIVGSTQAIAAGRYKTVNMVGAAVISAQINVHPGQAFPFVFGGDGAAFAGPAGAADVASSALAATSAWARREFDIGLRGAMTPVADTRAAGHDVLVARYQVSDGVDYAMFTGGGISWAEAEMKAGRFTLAEPAADAQPDLTGLSCRWSHMPAKRGQIISFVIAPNETRASDFAHVAHQILQIAHQLERDGHPSPAIGPGVDWPPAGATLEAHAQRQGGPLGKARRVALFESLMAWVLIKTGIKIGGFDARRYRRVVGERGGDVSYRFRR